MELKKDLSEEIALNNANNSLEDKEERKEVIESQIVQTTAMPIKVVYCPSKSNNKNLSVSFG